MSATAIRIEDMHCAACVRKVSTLLEQLPYVQSFQVNPVRRQVHVQHEALDGDFQLLQSIESLGFKPVLKQQSGGDAKLRATRLKRLGIAGICMMQVMMATLAIYLGDHWGMEPFARTLLSWASLIFTLPVIAYCATPFFVSACKALRQGLNMDVPIALAILIAFIVSAFNLLSGQSEIYFDSVVMFTFLMLGARQIDLSLRKTISTDDQLFASAPKLVQRLVDRELESCLLADVQIGDQLLIAEGELIPVDAQLLESQALIDEASFSGEADWVTKRVDEQLYAGTYNRGAALRCRVVTKAADSRAAQIERLADHILLSKAPLAQLADRVARWFVPTILLIAAGTTLGWWLLGSDRALSTGLAVLIVSCPCALALAVPAALSAAMARLRRLGLLLTNGAILELAPDITQLYFDKTGTLTQPQLTLRSVAVLGTFSERDCLALAARLQRHSSHPIAKAFVTQAGAEIPAAAELVLSDVQVVSGQGIRARLGTELLRIGTPDFCQLDFTASPGVVYLSLAGEALARFQLGAQARSDTATAIDRLQALGLRITMLSGDQPEACAQLAQELNIDYAGSLQPEAKRDYLRRHRTGTDKVMFVGDGINDALAFSEADVAIATLETTDLVRARAGAMLLTSRLSAIADLFETSAMTRTIMFQNLGWAALYNLIAIPSAMAGWMPPWLAAVGMASSSALVMLNATRLLHGTALPVKNT